MEDWLNFDITQTVEPRGAEFVFCDDHSVRMIRDTGRYTLVFVSHGAVTIRDPSGCFELDANQLALVEAANGVRRKICARRETQYYTISFSLAHGSGDDPQAWLEIPPIRDVVRPERLTYLLRRYVDQHGRRNVLKPAVTNLLLLILREAALAPEAIDDTSGEEYGPETIASRVDAYIAAHYREPIGSTEIAAELRYNAGYLERVYRQLRDISIRDAIHERRIREAGAQLLLLTDRPVADIARMCGYRDTNYFRRVFKRATNLTPKRYRCVHGSEKITSVAG